MSSCFLKTPNCRDSNELGIPHAPFLNVSVAFYDPFFQIVIAHGDTWDFVEAFCVSVGCRLQFCISTKTCKCRHLHRGDEQFWRVFSAVALSHAVLFFEFDTTRCVGSAAAQDSFRGVF